MLLGRRRLCDRMSGPLLDGLIQIWHHTLIETGDHICQLWRLLYWSTCYEDADMLCGYVSAATMALFFSKQSLAVIKMCDRSGS